MPRISKTSRRRTIGALAVITAGLASAAFASDGMPVAQQNALVQKYCAICHTDVARNGGLSLEHFDAAQAAPSLAAMMVSKLTSGVSLKTVKAASSDPSAASLVAKKMKNGAMGAAGIPIPDKNAIEALITALASEATGATEWNVNRTEDLATKAPLLTVSILREFPSAKNTGESSMYRLVLACNAATHEGEMQLTWAPVPNRGTLSAAVDGSTPFTYNLEGSERKGDRTQTTAATAAISLYESKKDSHAPRMLLPVQKLTISDLFPNETVEFPFGDLTQTMRQSLAACFTGSDTSH